MCSQPLAVWLRWIAWTQSCRLSLYRDECTLQWSHVAEAPLRAMIQGIPALRICRDPSCDQSCALFHPAVDEAVEQLFLDAWSRNFCRATGGKAKPSDAELFQIFVRVPQSALLHLFRASVAGLYVEPRAADGSPHSAWAVVWLPGMSQAQAAHALRTQAKAISLVRLGHKFGLRTKEADEQVVFEALRPSHSFVKLRIIAHWRLHPLPFGFQRSSITQLLKQWGWNARPLQPAKGDSEGCAWIVGAAVEPPAQTQPLGSTFVLITKVRDVGVRRAEVAKVCASQRTKKHMLLEDDPDVEDPWAHGQDPWSAARTGVELSASSATRPSPATVSKLEQIQADLRHDLTAMVTQQVQVQTQQAPPGLSDQDKRLHALEVGLNEVKPQNGKFEEWFQSFGSKVGAQATAVSELQATVQTQKNEIIKCRADLQHAVQHAVTSLQTELTQQLSSQLQGQFDQIQSLFSEKRSKTN